MNCVVVLVDKSNVLKDLFLFRNGENKGFLALVNKKTIDAEYDNVFKELMEDVVGGATADLVNELHALCSIKSVDADVQQLVDKLYEIVGGN